MRFKSFLSCLLAPIILVGGICRQPPPPPPVCTPGSGGSTPPSFSLPATVLGVQAVSSGPTEFTLAVTVPASYTGNVLSNTTYNVWCTNPGGFVPGSIVDFSQNPPQLFDPSGVATYTVYNSYAYSTYSASADTGFAGTTLLGTSLTLSQEWNAVNYVLNHLTSNGTVYTTATGSTFAITIGDTQAVIWQILHPTDGVNYLTTTQGANANAVPMYNDAVSNGTAFIPGNGQLAALILAAQTPTGSPEPFQGVLVPVTVNGGGCTSTSSATITKTANVTAAGPFQLVTFTYVIHNTGANTLTNIVVTDDNGTPNYAGDDFTVGTIASLNPGASATLTATAYLPLTLSAQSGGNTISDLLIPQIPSSPANSLSLTYLVDRDVIENTYNTTNPTIASFLGDTAEFQVFDGFGRLVSDFDADYLSKSSSFPSGYGSVGIKSMIYGNRNFVSSVSSTLSNTLDGYSKFYGATGTSLNSDPDWQTTFGYKAVINKGALGFFNWSWSAGIKTNRLTYSKFGSPLSYCPKFVASKVVSTAYLTAQVTCCGNATIWAKTTLCMKVTGCDTQPECKQSYQHKCSHEHDCDCPCSQCQSGRCDKCTQGNCSNPRCGDKGCPQQCQCHCFKCESGDHAHCVKAGCKDVICHRSGCTR